VAEIERGRPRDRKEKEKEGRKGKRERSWRISFGRFLLRSSGFSSGCWSISPLLLL